MLELLPELVDLGCPAILMCPLPFLGAQRPILGVEERRLQCRDLLPGLYEL